MNTRVGLGVVMWLWVAVPFGYGVVQLAEKVSQLFSS